MENRVAKLVKYSFAPTSCLAASLAEFKLFIHELCTCRLALPHVKISSCQHVKQPQSFDAVNVQGNAFYHYTPFLMAEFPMLKLCRLTLYSNCSGHSITQECFMK